MKRTVIAIILACGLGVAAHTTDTPIVAEEVICPFAPDTEACDQILADHGVWTWIICGCAYSR